MAGKKPSDAGAHLKCTRQYPAQSVNATLNRFQKTVEMPLRDCCYIVSRYIFLNIHASLIWIYFLNVPNVT